MFSAEYPLPPAQAALLRRPGAGNCLLSLSFGRAVDRALWRLAWTQLVQTHPILRTACAGGRLQEVTWSEDASVLPFPWEEPDWRELPPEEIPAGWQELQAAEAARVFDTTQAPLWRGHFLHLPGGSSHLLLTLHPALCDEAAAAQLLIEWFLHYEAAAREPLQRPPCAGLAAANGSLDFAENEGPTLSAVFAQLDPESASPAEAWAWGSPVSTEALTHTQSLPGGFIEAVRAQAARWQASPEEIAALIWAAFWASRTFAGESLTLVPLDVRPFLAPEHREVLGHLTPPLPWRLTAPPQPDAAWWEGALASLRAARPLIFSAWREAAADYARQEGFAEVGHVPGLRVVWREGDLNDHLHTALPRWLSADARWTEPAAADLEVRLHGVRTPRAEILLAPGWLPAAAAPEILAEFLRWAGDFLENRWPSFAADRVAGPGGFRLEAEPPLAERIEACLLQQEAQPLAEYGDTHLTAGEMAAFSNQLLRHLRKNRPPEGTRFLVCLQPGFYASLTALTLVRENWDAVWVEPGAQGTEAAALAESLQAGCLLVDSATQAGWPVDQMRHLVLDTEWEKIAAQSTAPTSPRKRNRPAQWEFLAASGARFSFGEAALGVSLRALLGEMNAASSQQDNGSGVRLLSSGTAGHPWILEEILLAVLGGAVLVWREAELFSTRSAFQEHLQAGAITHLVLPAARFADWVHFLGELNHALPKELRCVWLRAGHLGSGVLRAWARLAGSQVSTHTFYAPLGLTGLGLGGRFPIERWTEESHHHALPLGLLPMGSALGGVQVTVRSRAGQPLPPGSLGEAVWALPDDALTDGLLRREVRPELTVVDLGEGGFWGFPAADFPRAEWPQAPRRVRARIEERLLAHSQLFDGFTRLAAAPRTVEAWLVPWDSGTAVPTGLRDFLHDGLPEGWTVGGAVALPKWPVGSDGRIERASLPAPVALPEKVRVVEPTPQKEQTATAPVVTAPVAPPKVDFLVPADAAKPLLILCGELLYPGTAAALVREAQGESSEGWSVAVVSRWDEAVWELLRATTGRQKVLLVGGAAVWEVARWAARAPQGAENPEFLFVEPSWESAAESVGGKLLGWWERWRKAPVGGNTRREGGATPRPMPLARPARIIARAEPSSRLLALFPAGEFFVGDLSSPEAVAGAVFDILREAIEPDFEEKAGADEASPGTP